jgi:UDP-N-acetylmuramyl tripeptide synthase
MKNAAVIVLGKLISTAIKAGNLGNGSTWPGHLALRVNKHFIRDLLRDSDTKTIIIAGTNGKTTSALMLRTILEQSGKKVLHNESGANLMNGIASTILLQSTPTGKLDAAYAIFEVDENALPQVLQEVSPAYLLLLNLFRDQLDRYGEIDTIAEKWQNAIKELPEDTIIIANADDPKIAYLGLLRKNSKYYGLGKEHAVSGLQTHAVDSVHCPKCGTELTYSAVYYSHLGDWHCPHCGLKRPDIKLSKHINLSLSGTYNLSNAHGIIEVARELSTQEDMIANSLKNFVPAFGRQEKFTLDGKKLQIFLSKNPTGFNESLRTIAELNGRHVLFVLNDRIADGKDVSWIWDIDMETFLPKFSSITISGDRAYDFALRIKYSREEFQIFPQGDYLPRRVANFKFQIKEKLEEAVLSSLEMLPKNETLFILPTYTAMLDVRKILTGKKIL